MCTALFIALLAVNFVRTLKAQQVTQPEEVAGRWESPDGEGGEIGMNILVSTTVPSSATNLIGIPQQLESFEIGLYQRSHSDVELLGFRFFTTSPNGGATWDGRHLQIDLRRDAELPEVHVALTWNSAARSWTGSFQRGTYKNSAITLEHPLGPDKSRLRGTWVEDGGSTAECLHIAEAQDGSYTGWSDNIQIPGRARYTNVLQRSRRALEQYGDIAKVKVTEPDRVEVELSAYTGMCCPHPFVATLSRDGRLLLGEWPAGPNQATHRARWTRVQGDSCLSAASHSSHTPDKLQCGK